MSTAVEVLRARWIAKRNEFIAGRRTPGAFHDSPDDYAHRERRAYRLALVLCRDESLPGEWYWCRRDQRWDVYPSPEPLFLMRVVSRHGEWTELYYPTGEECRWGHILVRPAAKKERRARK